MQDLQLESLWLSNLFASLSTLPRVFRADPCWQGLLTSDPKYIACGEKATNGVVAQIQANGEVANVSFGTGADCDSLQHYKDIPITPMPYGQALAMWAIVEWQRSQ